MTQVSQLVGAPNLRPLITAENTITIPAAGNTVLLTLILAGMIQTLGLDIEPTVNNLDGFLVEAQFHPDGPWVTITSAVTSTPAGLILAASSTLATLAAAATGWLIMNTSGLYGVRFSASGSVADTTVVAIHASGS